MDEKKTGFWSMDIATGRKRYWIIYATALLLLLSGILAAKKAGESTDLNMRRAVATQVRHIAEAIPVDSVRKLSFSKADTNLPEFRQLCSQMKAYAEASGIRSLYSMALRNGNLVFGPETLNPDDPNASPPGTVYRTPTKKDFEIFNTGDAAVQGPDSDEYGDFVTATAPVIDPHTGNVLMTVGIDIEASVWQTEIRKAQWIPFLTAMAPLAMLSLGFFTLKIRQRLPATRHWKLRHVEAFTCAAIMLLLTVTAAALLHFSDTKVREENFRNQAQIKAEIYTTKFKSIHADLNLLDSFFESSDHISRREFRLYSSTLIKKNPIAACFWIPEIPAAEAVRFTKQVREDGLPEFSIWQRDEQNAKVPAQGSVFFPVLYVEPFASYEKALGFDVYSEPLRKAAIIEALSTGLPVATEPVTLISTSPQADQLLIVQPVQSKQGCGVAGFVLSPKEFLTNFTGAPSGEIASLSVSLLELRAEKPPLWLACARENFGETGKQPARKGLYSSTPVFAFGKTYEVLIV
ncbi:MAG: CHASE domain-containing protein, partial [Verrucomicrobia bacterium]|nr:CHASE domain-containing protein [Verrucomicrobiota bacterium]